MQMYHLKPKAHIVFKSWCELLKDTVWFPDLPGLNLGHFRSGPGPLHCKGETVAPLLPCNGLRLHLTRAILGGGEQATGCVCSVVAAVVSQALSPRGLQHARLPCPALSEFAQTDAH